jgi:hypothetical protein
MFASLPPVALTAQREWSAFLKPFFRNRVEPDHPNHRGSVHDAAQTIAIAALALSYASVIHAAAVTQSDLNKVGAEPPAHATLPLNLPLPGGRRQCEAVAILAGNQA